MFSIPARLSDVKLFCSNTTRAPCTPVPVKFSEYSYQNNYETSLEYDCVYTYTSSDSKCYMLYTQDYTCKSIWFSHCFIFLLVQYNTLLAASLFSLCSTIASLLNSCILNNSTPDKKLNYVHKTNNKWLNRRALHKAMD